MKSTLIVGIGASLLTAGIAKAQQRQDITPRTPNILFIYADDLGYGDLECYDGTQVKTPNINRLAKNGIRFTNAHATASTSTPSRFHANRRVRMAPPGNGHRRGKRRNDHTTGALYDSRYVQERGIRHGRYRQMASWPRRQSGRARLERPTPHRPWRSGI